MTAPRRGQAGGRGVSVVALGPGGGVPDAATLRRLYVVEQWSTADLTARFRVGYPTLRRWLDEAGIQVRPRGSGGLVRQLVAPSARELAELGATMSAPKIAEKLGVSNGTVRRWFAEAGVTPPAATLKNRPRGAATAVRRPTPARLRSLYGDDELSIQAVAQRLGFTVHLVRTWLLEDGTPIRPAGGRVGMARPGRPLKPAPAVAELRRLRAERLGRREIAARYGVHPQTVSKWLAEAGLPARLPPAGPVVTDTAIAGMYRESTDSAARIARRLGVPDKEVVAALRREGVALDPDRRIVAVCAAGARRRGTVPPLPAELGEQAAVLYRDQGWSYQRVAEHLGVTFGKVRAELRRRGIPAHTHSPAGPASRSARTQAPVETMRKLYVTSEFSAQDVAAKLDSTPAIVLRTGHAHGVPIRQGGGGHPAVASAVAVIEALYRDEQVSEVLDRHAVPRRPAGGDIAVRFPDPVPLTEALLVDLYVGAGCSSNQIELLTGQAQIVVRSTMHRLGIPLRAEHGSPALKRLRAVAREAFIAQIAAEYASCGSTAEIARLHDCSTTAVRRWLAQAGVSVPGRGQWTRRSRERPSGAK